MSRRIVLHNLALLFLFCLSTSIFGSFDAEARSRSNQTSKSKMKKESPFTCNVSGLDTAQRLRYEALLTKLNDKKDEVRELPDGYAFRFSADPEMVKEIAEFITYERLCCPFFAFELAIEAEGGPLWLRLKGRRGVKAFIKSEFGF